MKRASRSMMLCLVLLGTLSGVASASPRPLYSWQAENLMEAALRKNFHQEFFAHTETVSPVRCHRIGFAKAKCKIGWVVGDVGFTGKGSIWVHGTESGARWYYRFTIYRVNEYCALVEHGSYDECVERIHVS